MRRTLYIHIGPHKTGTTYVQEVLFESREELAPRGVHYLETGRQFAGLTFAGHHGLVAAIRKNEGVDDLRGTIARELSKVRCGKVFVSSENLSHLTREQIERFLSLFPKVEPRVLIFYRSWGPLLYSLWQEDVKHGSDASYAAFSELHMKTPATSRVLNIKLLFELWTAAVGNQGVALASYEAASSICSTVLGWAGIDHGEMSFPSNKRNVSLSPYTIETIRALNAIARSRGRTPGLAVREKYFSAALRELPHYAKALEELMKPYLQPAPNLDAEWTNYRNELEREHHRALVTAREPRDQSTDARSVVGPGYENSVTQAILGELWARITPHLAGGAR